MRSDVSPAGDHAPALRSLMALARRYGDASPLTARLSRSNGDGSEFFLWLDGLIRGHVVGEELAVAAEYFTIFLGESLRQRGALRQRWLRWRLLRALSKDARWASEVRARKGELRTLWGVTPINSMIACCRADRALGNESDTLVFVTYYITSNFDVVLSDAEKWIIEHRPVLRPAFRWLVFVWALLRYDVFNYYNDAGILADIGVYNKSQRFGISLTEMKVLKAAGKRLFTYAYGADHRSRKKTMAGGAYSFCTFCTEVGKHCLCDDDAANRMFAVIGRYADALVATGLAMEQIPRAVDLHYLVVDVDELKMAPARRRDGPLRIAHVPNHPFFKGTHLLEAEIEQVRSEGLPVELSVLSGVSHERIIDHMISCDVVADQFISGWYGGTTLEAMALGRPVLCYLREGIHAVSDSELPIINTHPEKIADVLRDLVARRDELPDIGRRSRDYVERYHSVPALAGRLRGLYLAHGRFDGEVLRRLQSS